MAALLLWEHCDLTGPLNYNPVEEWFFHRIKEGRPIPVPSSGQQVLTSGYREHSSAIAGCTARHHVALPCGQVTQLGHVKDLATAFVKCLGNSKASQQIYNISGMLLVRTLPACHS